MNEEKKQFISNYAKTFVIFSAGVYFTQLINFIDKYIVTKVDVGQFWIFFYGFVATCIMIIIVYYLTKIDMDFLFRGKDKK